MSTFQFSQRRSAFKNTDALWSRVKRELFNKHNQCETDTAHSDIRVDGLRRGAGKGILFRTVDMCLV